MNRMIDLISASQFAMQVATHIILKSDHGKITPSKVITRSITTVLCPLIMWHSHISRLLKIYLTNDNFLYMFILQHLKIRNIGIKKSIVCPHCQKF